MDEHACESTDGSAFDFCFEHSRLAAIFLERLSIFAKSWRLEQARTPMRQAFSHSQHHIVFKCVVVLVRDGCSSCIINCLLLMAHGKACPIVLKMCNGKMSSNEARPDLTNCGVLLVLGPFHSGTNAFFFFFF